MANEKKSVEETIDRLDEAYRIIRAVYRLQNSSNEVKHQIQQMRYFLNELEDKI